jgi:hypothetical protein
MKKFYVYFLRRPDKVDPIEPWKNCPFYVGKGQNHRYKKHRKEAKILMTDPGRKLQRIVIIHKLWKKKLDFEIDIVFDNLTEQEAFELEAMAIEAYGRIDLGTGILTNLTNGGEGASGLIQSEEKKNKLSKKAIGNKRWVGRKHSEEAKIKIGLANSGKNHYMFGKHCTEEQRRINSNSHKGKKLSEITKKRISEAKTGKISKLKGIPRTKEDKQKIKQGLLKFYENKRIILEPLKGLTNDQ